MAFDEASAASAATQRLDAHRARARVEIEESGAFYRRTENIEERLAQAVARGQQLESFQAAQRAAPEFAGDYAHGMWR